VSAALFAKAYPFAKRAVSVQSAIFAHSLRAAGYDREDLEQEVLLELFRALSHFDSRLSALRTFVDRVIARKAISVIRRIIAEKRRPTAGMPTPAATITNSDIRVHVEIQRAVTVLSAFDRKIAHLLLGGERPVDIARELNTSRAAVYRGIDRIRDALRRRGL
jgi:RNA polymerase sigma factor (sigma-70 family)